MDPLWAKAATKDKAARVVESMTDANKFDTFVPFPTASKDNNKYAPEKYWRGPVWLDQASICGRSFTKLRLL